MLAVFLGVLGVLGVLTFSNRFCMLGPPTAASSCTGPPKNTVFGPLVGSGAWAGVLSAHSQYVVAFSWDFLVDPWWLPNTTDSKLPNFVVWSHSVNPGRRRSKTQQFGCPRAFGNHRGSTRRHQGMARKRWMRGSCPGPPLPEKEKKLSKLFLSQQQNHNVYGLFGPETRKKRADNGLGPKRAIFACGARGSYLRGKHIGVLLLTGVSWLLLVCHVVLGVPGCAWFVRVFRKSSHRIQGSGFTDDGFRKRDFWIVSGVVCGCSC